METKTTRMQAASSTLSMAVISMVKSCKEPMSLYNNIHVHWCLFA